MSIPNGFTRSRSHRDEPPAARARPKVGQKPITVEVIENILANIDELEPRLTRHGYNAKVLAEALNAKPREIRALLRGQLPPGRAQELHQEMLAVGIPL